jgi:hypothetical protein
MLEDVFDKNQEAVAGFAEDDPALREEAERLSAAGGAPGQSRLDA